LHVEAFKTDQLKSTYFSSPSHRTRAVLSRISLPSRKTKSHTLRTVGWGKHVENNVKNHCIVNTFTNGGS
jgi:hypothetical protein